jgi:DNA-binding LacI/PurR family transcriptional regulator
VSEETRRRIQQVIEELDYRPNASARALKEGRTRTLGLVIPPASQRLTDMQLGGIQRALERADLAVPRDFSIAGVAARRWAEDFLGRV